MPFDFQNYILKKIQSEEVRFRISSPRKSKLGDYKFNYYKKSHSISVNIDLSEIQFLITFIHELAHKKCYDLHLGKVPPHGKEWKRIFIQLLLEARGELTLSPAWEEVLMKNVHSPKATHMEYTAGLDGGVSVSDLHIKSQFELKNGRRFQLIKKRRTRYLCSDLDNGQLYTVSGNAIIERLI